MRRRITLLAALTALVAAIGGVSLVLASPASAAASGLFKISCGYVGSAADDPIVKPGQPGKSHMHDFFGNRSTNANSTYASMQGVASSCPNKDHAAYWTPSVYQNGRKVNPTGVTTYYTNSISPGEERIEAFPPDFRMITGDAANTEEKNVSGHIEWGCTGNTQIGANGKKPPTNCSTGGIQVRITFPSCWNGVSGGTGNWAPNMRFPSGGKCPATHPRAFPTVRVNVMYQVGTSTGNLTLASGSVFSIHADFWNVWDQPTLAALVKKCFNGKQDCGHFKGTTAGRDPDITPNSTDTRAPATGTQPAATSSASPAKPGVSPSVATPVGTSASPTSAAPGGHGDHAGHGGQAGQDSGDRPYGRPGWAVRWRLMSEEGDLNSSGITGVSLIGFAFLVAVLLTFGYTRRRIAYRGDRRRGSRA